MLFNFSRWELYFLNYQKLAHFIRLNVDIKNFSLLNSSLVLVGFLCGCVAGTDFRE